MKSSAFLWSLDASSSKHQQDEDEKMEIHLKVGQGAPVTSIPVVSGPNWCAIYLDSLMYPLGTPTICQMMGLLCLWEFNITIFKYYQTFGIQMIPCQYVNTTRHWTHSFPDTPCQCPSMAISCNGWLSR